MFRHVNLQPNTSICLVGDTMDGHGRILFSNGDMYEGSFSRNLFDGQGTYRSTAGDEYTGQFNMGLQCGHGVMKYWNGCVYGTLFLITYAALYLVRH